MSSKEIQKPRTLFTSSYVYYQITAPNAKAGMHHVDWQLASVAEPNQGFTERRQPKQTFRASFPALGGDSGNPCHARVAQSRAHCRQYPLPGSNGPFKRRGR